MKRLIPFLSLLAVSIAAQAQERTHHGLYLSMGLGSVSGSIYGNDNSGKTITVDGPAIGFDFQMGGRIAENLMLHGTISVKSISGPTINSIKVPDNYSFGEAMIGGGLTKYFNHDFFFTGNIGAGNYSFSTTSSSETFSTSKGLSYQFKAGKEWWISKKWALGLSFSYSNTSLTDHSGGGNEQWNSNRYGILLTGSHFKNH